MLEHVAQEMKVPTAVESSDTTAMAEIDPNTPWAMFGMDSVVIVGLSRTADAANSTLSALLASERSLSFEPELYR
ncbi:hypothetical protein V7S43_010293 [Phytophthora oleae]|uniref:Uncharacterized protein n=1 Tax=Phytophthora oleae TaxID=2107226 RepID=A0ABD3FG82_9STRA